MLSFVPVILDFSKPWQLGFQEPATFIMEGIVDLHSDMLFVILSVCFLVSFMLVSIVVKFNNKNNVEFSDCKHHTLLELVWTILPALILIVLAVPSFALLFQTDEYKDPGTIVSVSGNQWYWEYKVDTGKYWCEFDSYMVPTEDLVPGQLRLLEVTNALYIPTNSAVRVLVTSQDVLHCWAVPALGVKVDACPGRLNQVFIETRRPGVFYGQCSEICGVNHGFMPIKVVAIEEAWDA